MNLIVLGVILFMAHEKVNVICENMCFEEGMTKEQITQGLAGKSNTDHNHDDRYKLIGDFAILTGSTEVAKSSTGTVTLNYPAGFTADNCVAISCGIKVVNNKGYNYEGIYTDADDLLANSYRRRLNLTNGNVVFVIYNPNTDQAMTVNYKIVLMKIS